MDSNGTWQRISQRSLFRHDRPNDHRYAILFFEWALMNKTARWKQERRENKLLPVLKLVSDKLDMPFYLWHVHKNDVMSIIFRPDSSTECIALWASSPIYFIKIYLNFELTCQNKPFFHGLTINSVNWAKFFHRRLIFKLQSWLPSSNGAFGVLLTVWQLKEYHCQSLLFFEFFKVKTRRKLYSAFFFLNTGVIHLLNAYILKISIQDVIKRKYAVIE